MFYCFSLISFIIIIIIAPHFLISILNAIPSVEDKMLISFMKGHQKMQISDYSMQKYEAHLGIVYFMRTNWQCDEIADEFEEYERTECQKYRKYLDILYEYLYREYAGIQTVKPKFVFKYRSEIEGPIIYALNCLVRISKFYFKSWSEIYEYKLNELFANDFEPKLLNEERLNYEQKLPMNEMILQLEIDTANECQTNEILDRKIRQNFNKNLEEMLKKAEERTKKEQEYYDEINDKHWIILYSKFDDKWIWTKDALFSEFVKGLATNSEKFFKMAEESSNYLNQLKKNGNIHWYDKHLIAYGLYENEKMKEHWQQIIEAHLGVVYLMRKNWQCSKIGKNFDEYKRTECQKYRKYLDILNEYLFRLYVEGKSNELAHKFPWVKPIFMNNGNTTLAEVIIQLNDISQCFWQKDNNTLMNINSYELNLVNEMELNYEIKEEESWFNKFKHNILEKINAPKNVQKKGKKILHLSNILEDNLRQEFEQIMKKMYENTKENAKFEKAKLEKAIENAAKNGETYNLLEAEFDDKFGTFNSSPFS